MSNNNNFRPYYGGFNFDYWMDRLMTAPSRDLKGIKESVEDILDRIEKTEAMDSDTAPPVKIINEKRTAPINVIQKDWEG